MGIGCRRHNLPDHRTDLRTGLEVLLPIQILPGQDRQAFLTAGTYSFQADCVIK